MRTSLNAKVELMRCCCEKLKTMVEKMVRGEKRGKPWRRVAFYIQNRKRAKLTRDHQKPHASGAV